MRARRIAAARAIGAARHGIGIPLLGIVLMAITGCTLTASSQYRERIESWERTAPPAPGGGATDDPFAGAVVLDRARLVAAVLARNPGLRAARHAWRAALERHPQVTALEDPMLGYGVAPQSFGERDIDDAHVVDLSQALPFPGKLGLRGEIALAEAEAMRGDFEAVRLRLATMSSQLYDDYYFLTRAIAINAEHQGLLASFQRIALARYESGQATQQDPLQAETEIVRILQRDLELRTARDGVRQQVNALLHRPVDGRLPAAPERLVAPTVPFSDTGSDLRAALADSALDTRPELRAAAARVRAREAAVDAARLEYFPDFTLIGNYNGRMPRREVRPYVGLRLNVPLQLGRRRAAVAEADARLATAANTQLSEADGVRLSVHRAFDRWQQATQVSALFETRLLPAARDRVGAARAGFETGRNTFLELIDAERGLREIELDAERSVAEVSRRAAELLRSTGEAPGLEEGTR